MTTPGDAICKARQERPQAFIKDYSKNIHNWCAEQLLNDKTVYSTVLLYRNNQYPGVDTYITTLGKVGCAPPGWTPPCVGDGPTSKRGLDDPDL